jgi:hypothetical protein
MEQYRTQSHVSVFFSFGLPDLYLHAATVYVGDFQVHQLANMQAGAGLPNVRF